jgi:gluconolactonase
MVKILLLLSLAVFVTAQIRPVMGQVLRENPLIDKLLSADVKIEVLATGMAWSEGPVWVKDGAYLLFSDIPNNSVMKWSEKDGLSLFLKPSGYTGRGPYSHEPGSNALVLDSEGQVVSCEHGDRRISVLTKGGGKRTLVDNYQGKRLNSPNDLVYKSNGDLYFTDPPYGLPSPESPLREMDYCGVFRLSKGVLTLLTKEMSRPNGLAFSPDEKTLYVANSDPDHAVWMSFPVNADGTLGKGRVFVDVTSMAKDHPGLPDGMKIDRSGNLFATGPGGIQIYTADGKRLGLIDTGQRTSNCNWGEDGSTLYITADSYLCRIRTKTKGNGW